MSAPVPAQAAADRLDALTLGILAEALAESPSPVRWEGAWGVLRDRLFELDRAAGVEALEWAKAEKKQPLPDGPLLKPVYGVWWFPSGSHYSDRNTIPEEAGLSERIVFDGYLDAWHWLLVEWGTWRRW